MVEEVVGILKEVLVSDLSIDILMNCFFGLNILVGENMFLEVLKFLY